MAFVIDTGVLLRVFEKSDPHHQVVRQMLKASRRADWNLITFPQNMAEFWVVSTRPVDQNGYGQSTETTVKRISFLERIGVVFPEHSESYNTWKQLVVKHQVQGKPTHDARIVAQMLAHGLDAIITLNPKDFLRYSGLTVLTPEEALQI